MVKMFYDADCNLSLLDGKTVAIIGRYRSGEQCYAALYRFELQ